jgi:hypothetical protein
MRRKEDIVVNQYKSKEKVFKQRDHLDGLSILRRIILKRILNKVEERELIDLVLDRDTW